uniref:Uncharacterized protein n=1 Tax=Aegilops tauschii subsp. strangulata TaxID=200361 RepID=A0A452XWU3_AEGTS
KHAQDTKLMIPIVVAALSLMPDGGGRSTLFSRRPTPRRPNASFVFSTQATSRLGASPAQLQIVHEWAFYTQTSSGTHTSQPHNSAPLRTRMPTNPSAIPTTAT